MSAMTSKPMILSSAKRKTTSSSRTLSTYGSTRATGAIVDYWGIDRLVTVGLKNTVSLSEATETAESYLGQSSYFTLSSSEEYLAVVTRSQNVENLAWVIKLKGYYSWDNDDQEQTYVIVVDAADGSVLGPGGTTSGGTALVLPELKPSHGTCRPPGFSNPLSEGNFFLKPGSGPVFQTFKNPEKCGSRTGTAVI